MFECCVFSAGSVAAIKAAAGMPAARSAAYIYLYDTLAHSLFF